MPKSTCQAVTFCHNGVDRVGNTVCTNMLMELSLLISDAVTKPFNNSDVLPTGPALANKRVATV